MPRINRVKAQIFAEASNNNGVFGSLQTGTKLLSNDIKTICSLPAYSAGWDEATISGDKLPAMEEMQGLQYVNSKQIAYLLNQGMPEYDPETTYYKNQFCSVGQFFYYSLVDNNLNHEPESSPTFWARYSTGVANTVGIVLSSSVPYGGTAPYGYLFADGSAFDPNIYSELAKAYRTGVDQYIYGREQQTSGAWWPKTPIIREEGGDNTRVDYQNKKTVSNGYVFEADGIIWGTGGGNHRTYYYGVTNSRGTYTRLMTYDWDANYGSPDNYFSRVNKGDTLNAVNISPTYAPFISSSSDSSLPNTYKLILAFNGNNIPKLTGIGPHADLINVNIPVSAWSSSTNEATVQVADVLVDSNIDLGLPVPTSFDNSQAVSAAGLVITGLGEGEVTFTCKKIPEVELNVTLKLWSE